MARSENVKELADFIWNVADLLRGDYKQSDYGKVILPLTVLRRLDCVLEPTKDKVLDFLNTKAKSLNISNLDPVLNNLTGKSFHNRSQFTFQSLIADPEHLAANLRNYINGFSTNGREIIEYFNFNSQITRLDDADLLFLVVNTTTALWQKSGILTSISAIQRTGFQRSHIDQSSRKREVRL